MSSEHTRLVERPIERLIEAPDASSSERLLLQAGRAIAPVEYDVAAGAGRFRAQLAALAAAGAVTAGAGASGSSTTVGGKALLAKIALKVVLGLTVGAVFAGAGVVAGMHLPRTPEPSEHGPARGELAAAPRPAVPTVAVVPAVAPSAIPAPGLAAPVASPSAAAASAPVTPSATPSAGSTGAPALRPSHAVARAMTEAARRTGESEKAIESGGSTPGADGDSLPSQAATPQPPPPVPGAAPLAPPYPAQPPASAPADSLSEIRAVALARGLVERDPEAALDLLQKTQREHPTGYFVEERQALTVIALASAGRPAAARQQAAAFLRAYPNGPYSDRVRAVTGL